MSYIISKNKILLKSIRIFFYTILFVLFCFGFSSYNGNKLIYFGFSIISIYSIFFAFRKKALFFETFFSVLLFLGYWFKFTMIISFTDGIFREGVGNFDYSPSNFDYGLIIASVGLLSVISFGHLREKFFFYPKKIDTILPKNNFFLQNRKKILITFIIFILAVVSVNSFFKIYQKGLLPLSDFNFFFSGTIKWLLLFGLTSISAVIIFFEINYLKKIFSLTILLSIFEVFLSSLSMISRGMIFNTSAIIYGLYKYNKKTKKILKLKNLIIYVILMFFFFYLSVLTVNYIRTNYFYVGKSVIETIKDQEIDKKKLDIDKKFLEDSKKKKFNIIDSNNEFFYLIINRWVGIDSTLVVSQNKEMLNGKLFFLALNEKAVKDEPTFYERTFFLENINSYGMNNPYENVKGNTLTGIISFLFYPGSFIFLFIGMFAICAFASLIEFIAYKASKSNLIFTCLIGQIIAFRYIHFGYLPKQSYLLFGSIILTLAILYLFLNKVMKN